ncbi:coiled-coil domain-containing protein 112-like [Prorops nasuta]|uniref:coiled-coil domain-containing protein 112-like n=1 Tax=Prorops nasuta TaxID=863751 RepID=UPI0034CD0DA7
MCDKVKRNEERYTIQRKAGSLKKSEAIEIYVKLQLQESLLDKDSTNFVRLLKVDTVQDITNMQKEINSDRKNVLNMVNNNIYMIASEIEELERTISDPNRIRTIDARKWRIKLTNLLNKIQETKKSCNLEDSLEEQTKLESELNQFYVNMGKVEKVKKSLKILNTDKLRDKKKISVDDYKNVTDFHSLIARTGHTEYWSDEDHMFFLKMRSKCDNVPALVAAIQGKCPDLSVAAIINHEAWYKMYIELREKQRSTIKEWRQKKTLNKANSMPNSLEVDDEIVLVDKYENSTKNEGKSVINNNSSDVRNRKKSDKNSKSQAIKSDKKKELIKKWREEKANKLCADEERIKNQLNCKKHLEEKDRKQRLEKLKDILKEYKEKKRSEEKLKELTKKTIKKEKTNTVLLQGFWKRDLHYVEKKKDLISHVKILKQRRPIILKKSLKIKNAPRCFTLYNSTKIWKAKCKSYSGSPKKNEERLYIKDIPRLATIWRNQESEEFRRNRSA